MSDSKPRWDTPGNAISSSIDEAGALAVKYGITPDRAQMLIDRFGHDPVVLESVARKLKAQAGDQPIANVVADASASDVEQYRKGMTEQARRADKATFDLEKAGFDQPAATAEAQRVVEKMDTDIASDERKND